jgi:hypothetical protein
MFTGAPLFKPWAALVWTSLNLASGVLAGLLTRRGHGRNPA